MIWLVGNKGMLGSELSQLLSQKKQESVDFDFFESDKEVDITDMNSLEAFSKDKPIQWIVNTAAYTNVDAAEDEVEKAYEINANAVKNLALLSKKIKARLLHISTDYVFSGDGKSPLTEDEKTNPQSIYGKSKLQGEKLLLQEAPESIIIRTSWLYGRFGKNFVSTMLQLMREKDALSIVSDQIGSPTWAKDLAEAIFAILSSQNAPKGIYHYSGLEETSWYDFAHEIYALGKKTGFLKKEVTIKKILTKDYPTKAKRPLYSYLDKEKIQKTFALHIPSWKQSLEIFFEEFIQDENI